MRDRLKKWCYLAVSFLGIYLVVIRVFPLIVETLMPAALKTEIERKELDPTGLFYTEVDAAFEAYLLFNND